MNNTAARTELTKAENAAMRLAAATETLAKIQAYLAVDGHKVQVATAYRATMYDQRHSGMFKATTNGLFVARGKSWDCITYCAIRFYKTVAK